MRSITLYIPGLFGPDIAIHPDDLPSLPALDWFLSRGEHQTVQRISPSYTLCELFGLSSEQGDHPVAAISRLSDDNQHPEGLWLRADPVNVTADRDGLILIDNNRFTLNQRDALALAADINLLFEPYGISLEVPVPTRWYLRVKENYEIKTVPVDSIVGKDILPFMPTGDDRINVIQLMNDIQMTLHNSDVNKRREQERQLPINSVWFWGYGELPKIIDRHWSFVSSDEILAKGLSMIAATPFQELPDSYKDIKDKGSSFNGLIVLNSFQKYSHYHDLEGWLEALLFVEENWFAPLQTTLKKKELDQLTIKTDINLITANKYSQYKFWKKKKNITCMDVDKKR
ncbi:MAG: hypothetical protein HND53_04370 [Proteobacteria bacterium]|nr:hypothetical protein [Pseudomonadota bacterium]NOG59712.1 hypothetical protein [Pseudomonadota bacterium]